MEQKHAEIETLLASAKELGEEMRRNQQELRETLKQLLGEDEYRQMQVETLRSLFIAFGDDPEMFCMSIEDSLDKDGVIIPDLEVVQAFFPGFPWGEPDASTADNKVVRIATGK